MTHEHKDGCCGTGANKEECKTGCCSSRNVTLLAVLVAIASLGYAFYTKSNSIPTSMDAQPKVDTSTLITGEDTVVARVNGKDVKKSEVAMAIKELGANVPPENLDQILPAFVDQYINLRLLNEAADKEGVDKDTEVQQQLYTSRDQIVRAAYLRKLFEGQLSDDALKATYKSKYEDQPMGEEMRARHILVDDEAKAKDLIVQLQNGASFEKLASENSKDPSAARGGDLGYFVRTEMVKEFADAAFAMAPGQLSAAPVKTQFGWHVIKVEDKRNRAKPTFEEAKTSLEQESRQALLDAKLQELRAQAKIENLLTTPAATPADGAAPAPADASAPAAPESSAAPASSAPSSEMPAPAEAPAAAPAQ